VAMKAANRSSNPPYPGSASGQGAHQPNDMPASHDGQPQQAIQRLATLDAEIGGFGIHSLADAKEQGTPPYPNEDRPICRPIQYVVRNLRHPDPEWYARDIAEMSCAHIEGLIKRFVERGNLIERFRRRSLGRLLHHHRVEEALPQPLLEDLRWLNSAVYTHVKHDFDSRLTDDYEEDRKDHLFSVDEALAIYVIARHLAVEIVQATV
jgi:hypothetical protein